ncbi:MAG: hypothetical protein RJA19_1847 [Bacteroidota bacterium]|jgi:hypothetical protein
MRAPFSFALMRVLWGTGLLLSVLAACAPNSQSSAGTSKPEAPADSAVAAAQPSSQPGTPANAPAAQPEPPARSNPSSGVPDWTTIERELLRAQSQCWSSARSIFPEDAARRQAAAQGFHSGMLQVIADKHQLTIDAMRAQLPEAARMLPE